MKNDPTKLLSLSRLFALEVPFPRKEGKEQRYRKTVRIVHYRAYK